MNNYSTIGRLTRNPETKFTTTGKAITTFDIAVDVGFGQNKKTIFWPCKLWGDRGEVFSKYVGKGNQVGITAEIDQDEWDDKKTGEKRKKLLLNVSNFTLISNGEKRPEGGSEKRAIEQKTPERRTAADALDDAQREAERGAGLDGDDIPF